MKEIASTGKRLSVVIVSWNGRQHLEQCLPTLRAQTLADFAVVLVDNDSTDGTIAFVRDNFPEVEIIALPANGGFAGPNNLGIARALADPAICYVVTLNNDTLADPHYLEELVACAERHPGAGAVQPKVLNHFERERIDSTGILTARDASAINRGIGEQDRGQFNREEEIFGASASAALYCREALETVALPGTAGAADYFDSDYFAYYEDVDLAWRLRLAGYSAVYAPRALVWHVHSATGKSYSPFKAFHIDRNHYYNMFKNLPFPYLCLALAWMPVRYLLLLSGVLRRKGPSARLAGHLKAKGDSLPLLVLRSWREVLANLPRLLRKRRIIQQRRMVGLGEVERWFHEFKADYRKILYG